MARPPSGHSCLPARDPARDPWVLDPGLFSRRDAAGGVPALFAGREVACTYNTRVAIRAAVEALGLKPGDEVLAPAFNCGSELDPLLHAGLRVRLYPVSAAAKVEPDAVAALVGPRTRAVYVTHYFGFLQPQLAGLRALCDRHGLRLLEDCALSLLSGAAPAEGRAGDVSFFCFYKFFPVIEGGALVVNRPLPRPLRLERPAPAGRVARAVLRGTARRLLGAGTVQRLRALRRRGRGPESEPGQSEPGPEAGAGDGRTGLAGTGHAGTGREGIPVDAPSSALPDMPEHYYFDPALQGRRISRLTLRALAGQEVAGAIARRRQNYRTLVALLAGVPGAEVLRPDLPAGACPLNLPLLVEGRRDVLVRRLQGEGIAATPWWAGYNRNLDWSGAGLEAALYLKDNLAALPIHHLLDERHLQHIAARLRRALAEV